MILINEFFSRTDDESADAGDVCEAGVIAVDTPVTFRELVEAIRYGMPSSWPATGDVGEWVGVDQGETRAWFEEGVREERTFHYSRNNPARNAKWWRLAFRVAGLTKEAFH